MYNITHGRRPTHRRSQADPRGRAPGRPSDARTRGTCQARGCWLVGGAAQVRGRVGFVNALPPYVRATPTASHDKGARNLRSGLRGVRTQAPPPQTASTMSGRPPRRAGSRRLPEVPGPRNEPSGVRRAPPGAVPSSVLGENSVVVAKRAAITPEPASAAALLSSSPTLRSVSLREPELRSGDSLSKASPEDGRLSPMSPVCFVTDVGGRTMTADALFLTSRAHPGLRPDAMVPGRR